MSAKPSEKEIANSQQDTSDKVFKFSQEEDVYRKHITLGIEEKLQKNRMIKDINLTLKKPTEKSTVSAWERKHGVSLPSDLKDYYFSTNGFKLTWSLEHAGDNLKIGEMNINSLNELVPLESMEPSDFSKEDGQNQRTSSGRNTLDLRKPGAKLSNDFMKLQMSVKKPGGAEGNGDKAGQGQNFSMYYSDLRKTMEANGQAKIQDSCELFLATNDKAFVLDHGKYGWVGLIYPEALNNKSIVNPPNSPRLPTDSPESFEPNVQIWFLDNSLQWHYLAPTFSHYYRMLLFHLGLPQWQYRFTPYGLSSWAEQMFWLVAPHLLNSPKGPKVNTSKDLWSSDVPPEAATPNTSNNVLSSQIFRRRKKDEGQNTGILSKK